MDSNLNLRAYICMVDNRHPSFDLELFKYKG